MQHTLLIEQAPRIIYIRGTVHHQDVSPSYIKENTATLNRLLAATGLDKDFVISRRGVLLTTPANFKTCRKITIVTLTLPKNPMKLCFNYKVAPLVR